MDIAGLELSPTIFTLPPEPSHIESPASAVEMAIIAADATSEENFMRILSLSEQDHESVLGVVANEARKQIVPLEVTAVGDGDLAKPGARP